VGFVKAQSDINADFALFADKGEFRQLISYHLTPPDMTQDEIDVRNAYRQIESYYRHKDLPNFMAMIDDNYLDSSCRTKSIFVNDVSNFLANSIENWASASIEEVLFDGPDYAYVVREWTRSYKWIPDQSYESAWGSSWRLFKKQADGSWKLYGTQNQIYLDGLNVVHVRRTPSETVLFINAFFKNCGTDDYIQDPDDIIKLTVSGPPGSGIDAYDMKPHWVQDDNGFRAKVDISKAVKGYYTFEWTDKFESSLLLTDYLSTTSELPIPVLISPINNVELDSAIVDFQWEPVAGANGYKVEVFDADTGDKVITGYTNINAYTNPDPLPAGKSYEWRVKARYYDEYGDMDSQSRCNKENFSIQQPPPCAGPVPCLTQNFGNTFYIFEDQWGNAVVVISDGVIAGVAGIWDFEGPIFTIGLAGPVTGCRDAVLDTGFVDLNGDGDIDPGEERSVSGDVNICNETLTVSNLVFNSIPQQDIVGTYIGSGEFSLSGALQIDGKPPIKFLQKVMERMSVE
jgi:ketosteroid isomerase-like protein